MTEKFLVELPVLAMTIRSNGVGTRTIHSIRSEIKNWLVDNGIKYTIDKDGVYVYSNDEAVSLKMALVNL